MSAARILHYQPRLLMAAWLALLASRVGLFVRAGRYRHAGRGLPETRGLSPAPDMLAKTIAAHVQIAARGVPRATCLARALALRSLLARRGYRCALHVGVARLDGDGRFAAHAWVSSNGTPILGEDVPGFADYAPLFDIR